MGKPKNALMKKLLAFIEAPKASPENNRKKVGRLLLATSIGLFFLFVGRLAFVVATDEIGNKSLKQKTEDLYIGKRTIAAKRGTIFDRYGNPIAEDATTYSIYAILKETYIGLNKEKLYAQPKDFAKIIQILHEELDINEDFAEKQLHAKDQQGKTAFQVEFGNEGKNLKLEKKLAIEKRLEEENIKGLYFEEHAARLYPNGDFASYLIGYVTNNEKNEKQLQGLMGIEQAYNKELQGQDGEITYEKDHLGNPVPGTVKQTKAVKNGKNIYTTIDSQVQSYLETLMSDTFQSSKPENMTAVLMKAKTGEILAMSQRPSFNPTEGIQKDTVYRNFMVEDAYEPGSTMKTMLLSAAISEGKFNPAETFPVNKLKVYDATIRDHDLGVKGQLNMRQAYSWSSNIGMVRLEQELGNDQWLAYLKKFGFGKSTDSGLPNETAGTLPGPNKVSIAMSAFGQAMSVSGLQMLKAYSAVANEGQMLQPVYVTKMVDENNGKVTNITPPTLPQVITKETAQQVLSNMKNVVMDKHYGTGTQYAIDGYSVGGKTGTAQIAENGKYITGENNFLFSIFTIAPLENPEYIMYVTIKKPTTFSYTRELPAVANPVMKRALDSHTAEGKSQMIELDNYEGQNTQQVTAELKKLKLNPVIIGNGEVIEKQVTKSGRTLLPESKVLLVTNGEKTMPDVTGWTKGEILRLEDALGKDFTIVGNEGTVAAQSLPAGGKITKEEIRIVLK